MKLEELKNNIKNEYRIVITSDSKMKEEVFEQGLYQALKVFKKLFDGKENILEVFKRKKR